MRLEIEVDVDLWCICGKELKGKFEERGFDEGYELHIYPCTCGKGVEDKIEAAYQRGLFESRDLHYREGYDKGHHDGWMRALEVEIDLGRDGRGGR